MSRSLIGLLLALALGCGGRTANTSTTGEGEAEAEAEADGSVLDAALDAPTPDAPVPACQVGGEMVLVPAGPFWMGCNEAVDTDCDSDEYPYHEVTLSAFCIDRTEVTVEAYAACVDAGACPTPQLESQWCNWGTNRETHPMNCVHWHEAKSYCAWVEKVLPTEAEWEKAARGTDERVYPWGDDQPTCSWANFWGCTEEATEPVGAHPSGASFYGALDMAGNVREWVRDWYGTDYYRSSPTRDPRGPTEGFYRVMRGGSWINSIERIRASARRGGDPWHAHDFHGFRCASHE